MRQEPRRQGSPGNSIGHGVRRWCFSANWDVLVFMDLISFGALDRPHSVRDTFRHGDYFHICLHRCVLHGHLHHLLRERDRSRRPPPLGCGCRVPAFYALPACPSENGVGTHNICVSFTTLRTAAISILHIRTSYSRSLSLFSPWYSATSKCTTLGPISIIRYAIDGSARRTATMGSKDISKGEGTYQHDDNTKETHFPPCERG